MRPQSHRVLIEQADWTSLLPFTKLFGGFRMALQPGKLLLALMLVLLTYLGGLGLDLVWGPAVFPDEFAAYLTRSPQQYERFLSVNEDLLAKNIELAKATGETLREDRKGIFETTLKVELAAFERLILSATSLDFGVRGFLSGRGLESGGVLGALGIMVIAVPAWLHSTHPAFLAVFLLYSFVLTALLGGGITRLAAVEAGTGQRESAFGALRFTAARYAWFILAPVLPVLVAVVIGLAMAVAGLIFFNFPALDVVGALLFGLLLVGGFAVALILLGLLVGGSLLFSSLSVEGTDAFDAISRVFNYVLGRPWRYIFYNAVMLVYGAITYLFVGLIVFMTLWMTKAFTGLWVFRDVAEGKNRFDEILPQPRLGELVHAVNWETLDSSSAIAAAIVLVWVKLLIAVLPAFAVSYFFSQQTWIYLLLRKSADGTEFDEVYRDADDLAAGAARSPEKVEPAGSEQASE